jgi:hypothetical protein
MLLGLVSGKHALHNLRRRFILIISDEVSTSVSTILKLAILMLNSCLYLQLLCRHTDNLSKEDIPEVFLKKKVKK